MAHTALTPMDALEKTEGFVNPLHQFEISPLISFFWKEIDLSFTNASLSIMIVVFGILFFFNASIGNRGVIPSRCQAMVEILHEFVLSMLNETLGAQGRVFFPFIFSLFMFILGANLLGMIPGNYTVTSQIVVTFALSLLAFCVVTLIGIIRNGFGFFAIFFPKNIPKTLLPLIVPIEIISYLSRPISLSIRLFANMMAGHTMLKVFAAFTVLMGLWGVAPFLLIVILTVFETMVAALQAYVFTILTCIYLNDVLQKH